MARVKWGFSKDDFLNMTLREWTVFRNVEEPKEEEVYADDLF
jgi:hypothetical protein